MLAALQLQESGFPFRTKAICSRRWPLSLWAHP